MKLFILLLCVKLFESHVYYHYQKKENITFVQQPLDIQLNKMILIKCVFTKIKNISDSKIRTWKKNLDIIHINNSKYIENIYKNEMRLYIYNVSISDINSTYTCNYDNVEEDYKILITKNSFMYIPTKKEIIITNLNSFDKIMVNISKIYSKPSSCYLMLNDKYIKDIKFDNVTNLNNFSYEIIFTLFLDSETNCDKTLDIFCNVFYVKKLILTKIFKKCFYMDKMFIFSLESIGISSFLIITIMIVVVIKSKYCVHK